MRQTGLVKPISAKNEVVWSLTLYNGKYRLGTSDEQWCDFDHVNQALEFYEATRQPEDIPYIHIDPNTAVDGWNINPAWVRLQHYMDTDASYGFHQLIAP